MHAYTLAYIPLTPPPPKTHAHTHSNTHLRGDRAQVTELGLFRQHLAGHEVSSGNTVPPDFKKRDDGRDGTFEFAQNLLGALREGAKCFFLYDLFSLYSFSL